MLGLRTAVRTHLTFIPFRRSPPQTTVDPPYLFSSPVLLIHRNIVFRFQFKSQPNHPTHRDFSLPARCRSICRQRHDQQPQWPHLPRASSPHLRWSGYCFLPISYLQLDGWVICRIHERVRKAKKAKLDDNNNNNNNNNNLLIAALQPQQMDDQLQQQQDAIQEVGGNNYFPVEEFAQTLLQQQLMDYQQQEQRQQQYNPFQLVDDFFLQDDLSYGQYYLQPPQLWYQRQQEEVFLPQPQQQQYNDRPWGAGLLPAGFQQAGYKHGAEASEYLTGLLQNFI